MATPPSIARSELSPLGPVPPRETPLEPLMPGEEINYDWPLELQDEAWDVLLPEDDYEPLPEYGDFWAEQDAA